MFQFKRSTNRRAFASSAVDIRSVNAIGRGGMCRSEKLREIDVGTSESRAKRRQIARGCAQCVAVLAVSFAREIRDKLNDESDEAAGGEERCRAPVSGFAKEERERKRSVFSFSARDILLQKLRNRFEARGDDEK